MTAAPTVPGSVTRVLGVRALLGEDPLPEEQLLLGIDLTSTSSARSVVTEVDAALEAVARGLFPSWLPGADALDGAAGLDRSAAQTLADRLATEAPDYAPYVRALAVAALHRQQLGGDIAPELRLRGALRVIARSYSRASVVVVLRPCALSPAGVLSDAAEWIAFHGGAAVWIDVTDVDGLGRFPLVDLTHSATATEDPVASTVPVERVTIPPLAGMPAPNSPAEQLLERHLSSLTWASGRRWNTLVETGSLLDAPMRVDLFWADAMVVVEIDGPDHRTPGKYAADRVRDNRLQRIGMLVLRYTNEQVADGVAAVVSELHQVLFARGTPVQFPPGPIPAPRG